MSSERRVLGQVGRKAEFLVGLEVVAVAPHQRDEAAVFRAGWVDLAPAGQAVVLQIAEGGGVALLAREKVLVDAQDLGAERSVVLAGATLEMAQEVTLHGGGADALAPPRATPVDAIQVLLVHHFLEAFACSLIGLNTRQALAKRAPAVQAAALAHL
jgi:hypothetical protein